MRFDVTFHVFSYIQKESGVSLTLVFSLGPEKPVYKTNRADTHACLRGHLPLLSFCYTRFEFLRFKENKNQLGKRLLSICTSMPFQGMRGQR